MNFFFGNSQPRYIPLQSFIFLLDFPLWSFKLCWISRCGLSHFAEFTVTVFHIELNFTPTPARGCERRWGAERRRSAFFYPFPFPPTRGFPNWHPQHPLRFPTLCFSLIMPQPAIPHFLLFFLFRPNTPKIPVRIPSHFFFPHTNLTTPPQEDFAESNSPPYD